MRTRLRCRSPLPFLESQSAERPSRKAGVPRRCCPDRGRLVAYRATKRRVRPEYASQAHAPSRHCALCRTLIRKRRGLYLRVVYRWTAFIRLLPRALQGYERYQASGADAETVRAGYRDTKICARPRWIEAL